MRDLRLIRTLPAVFVGIALLTTIKSIIVSWSIWNQRGWDTRFMTSYDESLVAMDVRHVLIRDFSSSLFDIVIYPMGWLACAAFLTVILGIFDRMQVRDA